MNDFLKANFSEEELPRETNANAVIGIFSHGAFTLLVAVGAAFAVAPSAIDKLQAGSTSESKNIPAEIRSMPANGFLTEKSAFAVLDICNGKASLHPSPEALRMGKLQEQLMAHKGDLLNPGQIDSFKNVMMPFTQLDFSECMVSYSKLNNTIYTLLSLGNGIELRVTQFLERESSDVAFSIYYEDEMLLAGSGSSDTVADKSAMYVNQFGNYVHGLS